MIYKIFFAISLFVFTGCTDYKYTEDAKSLSTSNGQSSSQTSSNSNLPQNVPSAASCGALGYFNDLNSCRSSSYSNCSPTLVNTSGNVVNCYAPASNWQTCAQNPPTWSQSSAKFCISSSTSNGTVKTYTLKKISTATCNTQQSYCACTGDAPSSSDSCALDTILSSSVGGTSQTLGISRNTCGVSITTSSLNNIPDCSSGGFSNGLTTPTPAPLATCDNSFFNFECNDCSWVQAEVLNQNLNTLTAYFKDKGYVGQTGVGPLIQQYNNFPSYAVPLSEKDRNASYVINIKLNTSTKNSSNKNCNSNDRSATLTAIIYRNGNTYSSGTKSVTSCESAKTLVSKLKEISLASCKNSN